MSTISKHILFLPRWYPHQFDPMFGLFVKKHAEAVAIFNSVSVLYVQGLASKERFEKTQTIVAPNLFTRIYYYRISKCKLWNIIRYWYYLIIGFQYIYKTKGLPDLIHVHILTRLALFALFLKVIYNIPYVITEHWSRYLPIPGTYKGWLRKKLGKIVVKYAKAILPVSQNLAEAMQKHGLQNPNYEIVPNVVDAEFFQTPLKEHLTKQIIFLHVSTFEDRSKNISGILRAIKKLSEKNEDFQFWFVGDGMDFKNLKSYAEKLKIPEKLILFFGLKQGSALVKIYQSADYLVLFSDFENIPVVINEAQACGLPVIATNIAGIPEVINQKNGFLIEPGNEDQLVSTLEEILRIRPNFIANEIRKTAKVKYSYENVGQQINTIYNA